ncbi:rhodanese [Ferrigenium kumadai]|uniref:Rhodanese n=1 Tax=Ferrigenium kumadai TaxID=1682490 RepID=A0AAN1T0J0_9PROT|nr:rhodanese-like domain-containing protein [Ferrigenium kumadai]BBJ00496.1 rhodanese [Ferrigenium kumadai]
MSVATRSSHHETHSAVHALHGFVAESVFAAAREIAQEDGLRYAGDVTPQEAWALFSSGAAKLVDVRTARELQRVGRVPEASHVEWLTGAGMSQNPHFIDELESAIGTDDVVLFLCRSGKRSVAAAEAATYAGFRHAFNVLEGFEGDGSPRQGWLNHGLPSVHD